MWRPGERSKLSASLGSVRVFFVWGNFPRQTRACAARSSSAFWASKPAYQACGAPPDKAEARTARSCSVFVVSPGGPPASSPTPFAGGSTPGFFGGLLAVFFVPAYLWFEVAIVLVALLLLLLL